MTVVLTVRDVPDEVRDLLAHEAGLAGQSMQAYLLAVLRRHAAFARNRQLVAEIEEDLHRHGGAGSDAPDSAEVLARARPRHPVEDAPPAAAGQRAPRRTRG